MGLAGTYAAIVTPFRRGGVEVDLGAVGPHLAFLADRGADGVLVSGTTGEFASLSVEERNLLLDEVAATRGGLRMIAGVGAAALPDAIALARHAARRGADALLLPPPFYDRRPPAAGLAAFFRGVLEAVDLPVLLYHVPSYTGIPITPELVEPLLSYPHLIGLKDSGGDVGTTARFARAFVGRLEVFVGSDSLVAEAHRAGAVGAITALANVVPDLVAAVRRAILGGGDADAAQAALDRVRTAARAWPMPAALKAALSILAGLPRTSVRPPHVDLTPEEVHALETDLLALGIVSRR